MVGAEEHHQHQHGVLHGLAVGLRDERDDEANAQRGKQQRGDFQRA